MWVSKNTSPIVTERYAISINYINYLPIDSGAPGARAETHTLENLVTHRSEKFWLSRDCPYVRTAVRQK